MIKKYGNNIVAKINNITVTLDSTFKTESSMT